VVPAPIIAKLQADISPTSAEVLALRILFTGDHENWLVLRQFAVYTA